MRKKPVDNQPRESFLLAWIKRHRQPLINGYIFLNVAGWVASQMVGKWQAGNMGAVEITFAVQNIIFVSLFLLRRQHTGLDRNLLHQAVAVIAFFSGLAFMGQPTTAMHTGQMLSKGVTLAAIVLSILTLINLGRSFGVLIAVRKIETRGLYSVVRHPMYLSDILFRVGYIISHFNGVTVVLFILSSTCYVYRALLEEKFLRQQPEYQAYMNRVKYRFIPFIF